MEFCYTEINQYKVTIVLPIGYTKTKRYPTVYMHDGGNGAKQALNYLEHLIVSKQITPFILIGVEPRNRNDDYTPWPADSLLPDTPRLGGHAKAYLTILATEIKPYIDTHYATKPQAADTTIGGCSYGGLVTLFASYYFPDIFGNYILLSASFWFEDLIPFLSGEKLVKEQTVYQKSHIDRTNHKLYGYLGEIEGIYRQGPQQSMVEQSKKAFAILREEGFTTETARFDTCAEGTHDVFFFTKHFLLAIRWLLGTTKGEINEHLLDNR